MEVLVHVHLLLVQVYLNLLQPRAVQQRLESGKLFVAQILHLLLRGHICGVNCLKIANF